LIVRHAQPSNVDTVVVDGRILKRKGRMLALDWERVRREAELSAGALLQRAGLETATAGARVN
jgi:hypothetical protein